MKSGYIPAGRSAPSLISAPGSSRNPACSRTISIPLIGATNFLSDGLRPKSNLDCRIDRMAMPHSVQYKPQPRPVHQSNRALRDTRLLERPRGEGGNAVVGGGRLSRRQSWGGGGRLSRRQSRVGGGRLNPTKSKVIQGKKIQTGRSPDNPVSNMHPENRFSTERSQTFLCKWQKTKPGTNPNEAKSASICGRFSPPLRSSRPSRLKSCLIPPNPTESDQIRVIL